MSLSFQLKNYILEKKLKAFEELAFYDDFMFGHIMKNKDVCKTVLEILLDIKIERIEYPELQKAIEPFYTSKGVRLDVYVEDCNRIFDVEIQNSAETDIGKRTRYYQSMLDIDSFMKGQMYKDLKESIIIFLCRYDPFQKGIACYTIERTCKEDKSVKINDNCKLYVFNCKAYKNAKRKELKSFLKFIENNKPETDFTRSLYKMVEIQKEQETLKTTYFALSLAEQDAIYKGIYQGIAENKIENAKNLIAMNILSYEQISKAIGLPLEKVEELAKSI